MFYKELLNFRFDRYEFSRKRFFHISLCSAPSTTCVGTFFLLFLHVVIALKIRLHEIQQDLVCAVFPMRICIGEEKSKVTGGELIFQTGKG